MPEYRAGSGGDGVDERGRGDGHRVDAHRVVDVEGEGVLVRPPCVPKSGSPLNDRGMRD